MSNAPESAFPSPTTDRMWVEPKLIERKASDGATAYGQLFVPAHPNGCGVVFAHGGIKRQMLPGFHYMDAYSVLYETNQYLASKGCVVLSVEYRSSIMRGYVPQRRLGPLRQRNARRRRGRDLPEDAQRTGGRCATSASMA